MKIPKEITGKNRLRDFDICMLYIKGKKPEEIKEERNLSLTVRRIEQIIYTNAGFVNPRIAWPKSKRIQRLQRMADVYEGTAGRGKGELEILAELRKEIEGDKALVDQSTHKHFNVQVEIVRTDENKTTPDSRSGIGEFVEV